MCKTVQRRPCEQKSTNSKTVGENSLRWFTCWTLLGLVPRSRCQLQKAPDVGFPNVQMLSARLSLSTFFQLFHLQVEVLRRWPEISDSLDSTLNHLMGPPKCYSKRHAAESFGKKQHDSLLDRRLSEGMPGLIESVYSDKKNNHFFVLNFTHNLNNIIYLEHNIINMMI